MTQLGKILRKYPAFGQLAASNSKRIPFIRQMTVTDCGSAALAMVMAYHGKRVELDEIRQSVGTNRDGSAASSLLNTARWYGFRGRGVQVEIEALKDLPTASILFWEFRHYVVFDRLREDAVDIVDPASGPARIPMQKFRRSFTGIALVFEPSRKLVRGGEKSPNGLSIFREVLAERGMLARIVSTSLLLQLLSLAAPVMTGLVVDRVVPWRDANLLTILIFGLSAVVVFQAASEFVRSHLMLHLRTRLEVQLTMRFMDHLIDLPYTFFQSRSTGDLMMRLNSNNAVREILTSGAISALLDGSLVCLYLILLFVASPSFALLVLFLGVIRIALFLGFRNAQQALLAETLEAEAKSQSFQVEMLDSFELLKSMGIEHRAAERWTGLFVNSLNVSLARGRLDAAFSTVSNAAGAASPLLILAYGAHLALQGHMSLGSMMAIGALANGFITPLSKLVSTALQVQLLHSYIDRIRDVMNTPPEQMTGAALLTSTLTGAVRIEGLSFRYGERSLYVIRDVSFDVPAGGTVAIVGGTGSGKSTLVRLLVGLYKPTSGRVLFDGIDLAQLDLRSVRNRIGIVTQQTQLFAGSIRQNIALCDPHASLARVIEAARLACIHDEIMAMPMGYETAIADRGLSLSGGQRQRLAIARAVLTRPRILILDEATSSLDGVTEASVSAMLATLRCTRIVIAHRLSTIRQADQILAMEWGQLAERGTHDELLEAGGLYARLVRAQINEPGRYQVAVGE